MSGSHNGRFQHQLEAFEHDRQAFRDAVAALRTRGEAILSHSDAINSRTDGLVADLEALRDDVRALKDETYRKTGVTLERVESQRLHVEQMVQAAADSLDALRTSTESEIDALRAGTESHLATLRSEADRQFAAVPDLLARTDETLRAADTLTAEVASLRDAIQQRLEAAGESLLQASSDISGLLERVEKLESALAGSANLTDRADHFEEQSERGAKLARQAAAQLRTLARLRTALAATAILSGLAVGAALGLAVTPPASAAGLPLAGLGIWVLASPRAGKLRRSRP